MLVRVFADLGGVKSVKTRLRLTDAERVTLAEIARHLGRKALEDVANVLKPDTQMDWHRRLVARRFDGSKSRRYPGSPRMDGECVVLRMYCDTRFTKQLAWLY